MAKWRYSYSGLRVESDIELPDWRAFQHPEPFDVIDVQIQADIVEKLQAIQAESPAANISVVDYSFTVRGVGHYRVTNGNEIVVTHKPDSDRGILRLFLQGSAWAGLCYQRGICAIHAGAVQVGNGAVAFCGSPGKGKSTISAWLTNRGHALLSDDLCCIDMSPKENPLLYPSAQRFRLWNDALDALGWNSEPLERDYFRMDKYIAPWSGICPNNPLPLRALYILEWGTCKLEPLSGITALQRFMNAATYRSELIEQMELSGAYWQSCLSLLQQVPVWELSRPKDLTSMDHVVDMLEKHWETSNSMADQQELTETSFTIRGNYERP